MPDALLRTAATGTIRGKEHSCQITLLEDTEGVPVWELPA
jgi:hypothetical protein